MKNNKEPANLVVIVCPPLSYYPEAPKDQSYSELVDCPKCSNKMWLSAKKKALLEVHSMFNDEILLACYNCFTKIVRKGPEYWEASEMLKI